MKKLVLLIIIVLSITGCRKEVNTFFDDGALNPGLTTDSTITITTCKYGRLVFPINLDKGYNSHMKVMFELNPNRLINHTSIEVLSCDSVKN